MAQFKAARIAGVASVFLIGLTLLSTTLAAQTTKVEGLIKGRNGDRIILKTTDAPNLVIVLTDNTEVGQVQGVLKVRRKEMSMAALIPGLAIKAEGTYNDHHELIAASVSFKGDDLKQAESVQAGLHETQVQAHQNKADLEKQNAALKVQQQQIAGNKADIDAAVARFGQLDDYYIFEEVTVYFGNGKTKVDSQYTPQLLALAEKAKTVKGYMIEVRGYASSPGSAELNQQLSEDRANEIANILIQQGHISLTRMLAPGAMGETQQVGNDKTADGQAQNRRVVVRVLQNKAIAGI
jgi:outer membrane protein OmpA-like peptidoglycan-associated protein